MSPQETNLINEVLRRLDAQDERSAVTERLVAETHEVIHGRGEAPGIKGRLDRIEQREVTRSRIAWAGLAAGGAAIIAATKTWLTAKGLI